MKIRELKTSDFGPIQSLSDSVFGLGYIDKNTLNLVGERTCRNGITSSFVLENEGEIIGFRLTYAAGTWLEYTELNYTTDKWKLSVEEVCYFKVNCLHSDFRGKGLGQRLLETSISASMEQGAKAGVADIWLNSPNNSAYRYFERVGGEVVNIHHGRWRGNPCIRCYTECRCLGAEMILRF